MRTSILTTLLLTFGLAPSLQAQVPVEATGRRGGTQLTEVLEQLRAQLEAIEASSRELRAQLDTMAAQPGAGRGRGGRGAGRGRGGRGGRGGAAAAEPTDPEAAAAAAARAAARFERQIENKARTDAEFAELSDGYMDMQKIVYQSRIGGMDIPCYVFQPLETRGPKGHAALLWLHGGVHGDLTTNYWPYIYEATQRGYVVVCPEYRGSTGYGQEHYDAIDYGGWEVDDCLSAVDWIRDNLPHVDLDRLGIMGWSHGGFITLHSIFREPQTFKAAVAMVPVTNLVFRLSYKGPGYQRSYVTQERIGGLPYEVPEVYIERSPLYHVDKLETPLVVHVTRNDRDVNFVEDQQMIHALEYAKPKLVETRIYDDPVGGHSFQRLADEDDPRKPGGGPESRDSWNRVWAHFEWYLRPYEDHSIEGGDR